MKVCPDSNVNNVRKYLPGIVKAMAEGGLTSRNQLIGVIATIYTETTPFAPIREYGLGAGHSYRPYYGRGFIQLTHKSNFQAAERDLKIPGLVANPDLALQADVAAKILVWFWKGATGNNPMRKAEAGDWRGTRKAVNGGFNGWDEFSGAVERGLKIFTRGIDPNAVGVYPADGSYGLGCVDAGSGQNKVLAGVQNPTTQGNALIYALGLHARDRQSDYSLETVISGTNLPDVLKLDAQKTFELKGMADDLNGTYTVEEMIIYPLAPGGIEVEISATKPDPNAPPPQVFLHDSTQGMTPPDPVMLPTPVPAGDIPGRIYKAAIAAEGRSSRQGPGSGNVSCAWAVNLFCVLPAGLQNIGKYKNPDFDNVSVAVADVKSGLEGGRGQRVSRAEAVPGDIVIWPDESHIGICMAAGCTDVLSNSSSKAKFAWRKKVGDGWGEKIYRVTS